MHIYTKLDKPALNVQPFNREVEVSRKEWGGGRLPNNVIEL